MEQRGRECSPSSDPCLAFACRGLLVSRRHCLSDPPRAPAVPRYTPRSEFCRKLCRDLPLPGEVTEGPAQFARRGLRPPALSFRGSERFRLPSRPQGAPPGLKPVGGSCLILPFTRPLTHLQLRPRKAGRHPVGWAPGLCLPVQLAGCSAITLPGPEMQHGEFLRGAHPQRRLLFTYSI